MLYLLWGICYFMWLCFRLMFWVSMKIVYYVIIMPILWMFRLPFRILANL